jgi:hypothetical protein
MEFGKIAFELDQIKTEDLEANINFVIVGKASFGSAVALRNFIEKNPYYMLVHFSMSNMKIFAAKQHDLTEEKQIDLGLINVEVNKNGRFKRKNRS